MRRSSICPFRNTLLSIFTIKMLRTPTLASTTYLKQTCASSLQLSLVYNKNVPYSTANTLCSLCQGHLRYEKNLFVDPTTESDHRNLSLFTQITSSDFCGHVHLIKSTELACIVQFNTFLTVNVWEGEIQLHLDLADHLGDTTQKEQWDYF